MVTAPSGGVQWRLQVSPGPRERREAPLVFDAPDGAAAGDYVLVRDGETIPAQVGYGRLLAVFPALAAGVARAYTLRPARLPRTMTVAASTGSVAVAVGDAPFTTLHLEGAPKPYLYPLLAPGGVCVLRGWPVDPQIGDPTDHVHHRGAWIGHGDVNGADTWDEREDRIGRIVAEATAADAGGVAAHIATEVRWVRKDGTAVLRERRLYRFWAVDDAVRLFDVESTYSGVDGAEVRWGDTKEGALCGVRVAHGMEGRNGGRITTAEGAIGEAEAWGSAAGWCDYTGVPAAEATAGRNSPVGVAIFDNPGNPLHPMRWHVRDYGLMAANPFALSHYLPKQGRNGEYTIPAGDSATFRFRVLLHRGGVEEGDVARRYADWAFPPRVKWEQA